MKLGTEAKGYPLLMGNEHSGEMASAFGMCCKRKDSEAVMLAVRVLRMMREASFAT